MRERAETFLKREIVVLTAGILSLISCFFASPGERLLHYWNPRFLMLLFCYLLTTQGMKECNAGERGLLRLLCGAKSLRGVQLRLLLLSFLLSMFLANELVLLLIFPLTIQVFSHSPNTKALLIHTLVLLTLSVSLGGMLLPFGNMQNLYLYTQYGYSLPRLFRIMLPFSAFGFLLLLLLALCFRWKERAPGFEPAPGYGVVKWQDFRFYLLLFLLTIAASLPLLPDRWILPPLLLIAAAVLLRDRRMLLRLDYSVLVLFFFLSLLGGNLEAMGSIGSFVTEKIWGHETLYSVLLSQLLGNVPTAVLLSRFTTNGRNLIVGCNLGGMGLFWASMTGLQSLRLYARLQYGDLRRYLLHYAAISLELLAAMLFLALFTGNL